jgi:hypothetical protein
VGVTRQSSHYPQDFILSKKDLSTTYCLQGTVLEKCVQFEGLKMRCGFLGWDPNLRSKMIHSLQNKVYE